MTTDRAPRPYQLDAVSAWSKTRRGVVVMPTGTGKTFTAFLCIEKVGRPTLIVTPTIDLMNQWYSELTDVFGVEVGLVDVARLGVTARQRHLGRALEDGPTGLANPGREVGGTAATRDATEVTVGLETSPAAATTLRVGRCSDLCARARGRIPCSRRTRSTVPVSSRLGATSTWRSLQ